MGERLSTVDLQKQTAEWPPKEVIQAQRAVTQSMAAQAERELRRNARSKQGEAAKSQANSAQAMVGRLASFTKPASELSSSAKSTVTVAKVVGVTGAVAIAGLSFAMAGVGNVLALAAQPMFLGIGLVAAVATYFAGGFFGSMGTSSRFKMLVDDVEFIRPGLIAIHFTGENLEELPVQPGQIAEWQFAGGKLQNGSALGYLSCVPREGTFRVMFLSDDETSEALRVLPAGTKVSVKEPEGLSPNLGTKNKALLIAGGEGIIPMRALFEAVPGQVTLMYREGRRTDVLLLDELKQIGAFRRAKMNIIVGSPARFPAGRQPLCTDHLASAVPDIRHRDVYVAGSDRLVTGVVKNLRQLGVPKSQIHVERV